MSNERTSPGPWKTCAAAHGKCSCGVIWDASGDWSPATVHHNHHELGMSIDEETFQANKQLIASAPTLKAENTRLREALEACEAAMRMQEGRERGEFHISQPSAKAEWDEALRLADRALRGEPA